MRRMWRFTLGDQRGAVFLASLVLVLIMTILGVALFSLARIEGGLVIGDASSTQLLYCAEAALGRTMADYAPAPGGRMAQIATALYTGTPPPAFTETVTVTPPLRTCNNSVVFTPSTGKLQATAFAPDGTWRSVRIQLLNLSWQAWTPGDVSKNGAPFWDKSSLDGTNKSIGNYITNSGDFASCGSNCSCIGPGCSLRPTNSIPGPGAAIPSWGQSYNSAGDPNPSVLSPLTANTNSDYCSGTGVGCANPNVLFNGKGGTVTFTLATTDPNAVGYDKFGWFESDTTGSVPSCPSDTSKCHQLIDFSANNPGAQNSFTTSADKPYYGFYLNNNRGTFYTLAGLAANAGSSGNEFVPDPRDWGTASNPGPASSGCDQCTDGGGGANQCRNSGPTSCNLAGSPLGSPSPIPTLPYQHFSIFKQNPTTYWVGVENVWNLTRGKQCKWCSSGAACSGTDPMTGQPSTCGTGSYPVCYPNMTPGSSFPTSCIERTVVDQDYQDLAFKVVVPSGDVVVNQGPGMDPRVWKDWQECVGPGTPPSC